MAMVRLGLDLPDELDGGLIFGFLRFVAVDMPVVHSLRELLHLFPYTFGHCTQRL